MRIRDGIDFRILVQPLPYLSKELFLEYVCEVFLPAVEVNRELPECRGKLAILFWDSCFCHCSDDILRELPSHRFFLITYPRHSSHILQVLDITLLAKFKSTKISAVHECSILTCLPLFNLVQKFICDMSGNVVTISINQALESIHPVDKNRFDHFD
jgi:hypothetical protein